MYVCLYVCLNKTIINIDFENNSTIILNIPHKMSNWIELVYREYFCSILHDFYYVNYDVRQNDTNEWNKGK